MLTKAITLLRQLFKSPLLHHPKHSLQCDELTARVENAPHSASLFLSPGVIPETKTVSSQDLVCQLKCQRGI